MWNYKVIRKRHADNSVTFHIHEVYYREDRSIESWTEQPVTPMGEEVSELREDIRHFSHAFRHPVLEERETNGHSTLCSDEMADAINDDHYFELMDRASVASDYIYQFLGSHPLMREYEDLRTTFQKASEALAQLYQQAARLEFDKDSR